MKLFSLLGILVLVSCDNPIKRINIEGGYKFSKVVDQRDTNFFSYPLKNFMSRYDSFSHAYYGYYWHYSFDEPNISLKPSNKAIFRFSYDDGFSNSFIIKLTEQSVVVKKASTYMYPQLDETKLPELEQAHYYLLRKRFPLDEDKHIPEVKKRVDSMIKLYPQLLDPNYYRALITRAVINDTQSFKYSTNTIALNKEKFNHIFKLIAESGYWTLPYEIRCANSPMDGYGFVLEANIGTKYNIVKSIGCPGDTSKFTKACQQLIKLAKLDSTINLIWPRE